MRAGQTRRQSATMVAVGLMLALLAGGCRTTQTAGRDAPLTTGSIGQPAAGSLDQLRARYDANPRDPQVAMTYGRALRANGQRAQAMAVLQQASMTNPKNMTLLGEYGRALADNGQFTDAIAVFERAHTPEQPDWRILSAHGAALDQLGKHSEAQRYYATALRIRPDEPTILSNLGLSYALSKQLPQAEATLRRAAAQPGADSRVRQNLAMVLALQGQFADAESIASKDLPPDQAAANISILRGMVARGGSTPRTPAGRASTPPRT